MPKQLHAVEFNGITFGMKIKANTAVYRTFKKSVKREKCIDVFGNKTERWVVPYLALGAIMEEAHWLVTECKSFNKIQVEGFMDEDIYVKYTDEPIDFRNRQAFKNQQ